ncbi:MAG: PCRF domain-containing protein, partial [Erysipelotrichaceae bacterium]|nr:PCRF domain-containing protein [Erysipelotrichaceae bacterium]
MNTLLQRLETVAKRYDELTQILMDPSIATDIKKMTSASKEQASLENAYRMYQEYKTLLDGIEDAKILLEDDDPEIAEMAQMELLELEEQKPDLEHRIQIELIPKDPNDEKNIIIEIRGAAGGDEGNIFAGDLYRMYTKYAESQGWKIEVEEAQTSEAGGYSLISFMVK